jgi:hypothetical protein
MYEIAEINNPEQSNNSSFGYATANGDVNGDGFQDLIVGSYSALDSDKVYIWFGGSPFDTLVDLTFTGKIPAWSFGSAVASGNVNNDTYEDVFVGGDSQASLYYGGNPMDTTADWIVRPLEPHGAGFGDAISLSDLNGDSYADLVVGAAGAGPNNSGAVYIYWGDENPDTLYDIVIHGIEHARFGNPISGGNYDVNGDGAPDLAVGAPDFFSPPSFPKISIFYGSDGTTEFDTVPDVKIFNPCNELAFGDVISLIKDINGDGYDDLAAGAQGHKRVYIYYGGNPMDSIYDVVLNGDSVGFGMDVTGIDNANGDMFGDILIGNPHYGSGYGRVYLYHGGDPFDTTPCATVIGADSQEIGWSVGCAGDLNNDGKDEMLFSNSAVDNNERIWITNYCEAGVKEKEKSKKKTGFFNLHPNPFSKFTTITYSFESYDLLIQNQKIIKLKIYNLSGRVVKDFKLSTYSLQPVSITWDGTDYSGNELQSGIYFIKLSSGEHTNVKKIVLMK